MTFPLPELNELGESEFSHGKGLQASAAQRAQTNTNLTLAYPVTSDPEGPWEPSPYSRGKAVQRTDSAEALAQADYAAEPFTPNNNTGTQWERE